MECVETVKGVRVRGLVDTGAMISLVSRQFVVQHQLEVTQPSRPVKVVAANGGSMATLGQVQLAVQLAVNMAVAG